MYTMQYKNYICIALFIYLVRTNTIDGKLLCILNSMVSVDFRYPPVRAVQIVKACIVLHNIAVKNRVPALDWDQIDDDPNDDNNIQDNEEPNIGGRLVRDRVAIQFFA